MAWIAGKRVWLRAWERDDVRARWEADQTADATEVRLRDWHEPPRSLAYREQEFDASIAETDESAIALIIEADGRAIGDINLFDIDARNRRASVGLSIWRPDDRNKGFGTDAIRALLGWAFREYNLHRVDLSVDPSNAAAIRVYENVGFVREGCRREAHYSGGKYVDDLMMGLLRADFNA
jgi:RimJ/RimL family protein N-acetyltransferase